MRAIVICDHHDGIGQAIYIDGKLVVQDDSLYAVDVAGWSGGEPCTIEFRSCDLPGDSFPDELRFVIWRDQPKRKRARKPKDAKQLGINGVA